MDYKKAYEEALERAKKAVKEGMVSQSFVDDIFGVNQSEDERIRKWLIEEIKATHDYDSPTSRKCVDDALAYLEKQKEQKDYRKLYEDIAQSEWFKKAHVGKSLGEEDAQKEQKPLSTEETELNSIAFLEQMGYTCIPPKKEHQNNADTPNESSWAGKISSSHKDKNLDEIAQDYIKGVKECNPEPTWDLIQTAVCYGYHLAEQRSSEWSEEDKDNVATYLHGKDGGMLWSKAEEITSEILDILRPMK